MEITRELRTLAKFTSETMPVLSVYLNTQWYDQYQRERVTTFLERHLRQAQALEPETPEALESLTRDLDRLTQWGQQHIHNTGQSTTPGVVLFACAGADLWVTFPSPLPFEDEFAIADRPILRQLARLDDDYTNALLVLIDSRTARVYEIVLDGFLAEVDFASAVPGRHKQGGWAQARYQRRLHCRSLSEEIPLQCSVCGGEVRAVELGEAMVSGVLQTDGFVELIEPDARLAAYEGVGAFLRYQ